MTSRDGERRDAARRRRPARWACASLLTVRARAARAGPRRTASARRSRSPARARAPRWRSTTPATAAADASTPSSEPVAQAHVAVAVLAPGADQRRPGRSPAATSPRRRAASARARAPAPGTKRLPPPTPSMPATTPASDADERPRSITRGSAARSRRRRAAPRTASEIARTRHALLQPRADEHAADRGDPDQQPSSTWTLPYEACTAGGRSGDDHDRRQRRARRLALAEAEPQDQQRHDDDSAPTPNSPLNSPPAVPIAASSASGGRAMAAY